MPLSSNSQKSQVLIGLWPVENKLLFCGGHFVPRHLSLGSSRNCSSVCAPTPGYVKLPPEKFAPKKQGGGSGGKDLPTEAKKLQLNSAEELYAEIRDKNFNAVGSVLSKKAKIISAAFEVRHAWLPPFPGTLRGRCSWLLRLRLLFA